MAIYFNMPLKLTGPLKIKSCHKTDFFQLSSKANM